jgi:hypothetical protein
VTEYSDHPHETGRMTVIGLPEPVSIAHGLPLDVDAYRPFIADLGLSDDQERQMIEALAFFVLSFVDQGFGVHPAQQACGKLEVLLASMAGTDSDGSRKKNQHLTSTFNRAASDREDSAR